MNGNQLPLLIIAGVGFVGILVFFVLFLSILRPWLRAYFSGARLPLMAVIGMKLRRVDANKVIDALILSKHHGANIRCSELEIAYLSGCDPEKLTLAMIEAQKRDLDADFNELVDAELKNRLKQLLED